MIEATVIIAAWNAAETLRTAVASALAQRDLAVEVIVVDDASTDTTVSVAETLMAADDRVRLVRMASNGGPAAARNAAIAKARGRWVAILDADDGMTQDRLARMVAFADARGADVVLDDVQPVDGAGHPVAPSIAKAAPGFDRSHPVSLAAYIAGNQARPGVVALGYLKPLIRRAALVDHGICYDETLRNGEDFHLVLALLAAGCTVWFLAEAGYRYTRRDGSVSAKLSTAHAIALADADRRFLERHGSELDANVVAAMKRRRRRIEDLAHVENVIANLRDRRMLRAVTTLARRPASIGRLALQIREGVSRRLGF